MSSLYWQFKRKLKSMDERILLLEVKYFKAKKKTECQILNEKNKEYTITIIEKNCKFNVECTCLDYMYRKRECKHIYWLGINKINDIEPKKWLVENFRDFVNKNIYSHNDIIGRNDNCLICLEEIDYIKEKVFCCHDCLNAVHHICWKRYNYIGYNESCVFCRSSL